MLASHSFQTCQILASKTPGVFQRVGHRVHRILLHPKRSTSTSQSSMHQRKLRTRKMPLSSRKIATRCLLSCEKNSSTTCWPHTGRGAGADVSGGGGSRLEKRVLMELNIADAITLNESEAHDCENLPAKTIPGQLQRAARDLTLQGSMVTLGRGDLAFRWRPLSSIPAAMDLQIALYKSDRGSFNCVLPASRRNRRSA